MSSADCECPEYNFCMTAGVDRTIPSFTWKPGGVAADLAGSQILFKIRKKGAAANILEIDSDAPSDSTITILTPTTDGKFSPLISAVDSTTWKPGVYIYEATRLIGTSVDGVIVGEITVRVGL